MKCCALILLIAALPFRIAAGQNIWVEPTSELILPDRPAGSVVRIELTGIRNAVAACQLGLRWDRDGGEPLSLEWTALKRDGGDEIARTQITIFRAADIEIAPKGKPATGPASRPASYIPDALVPLLAKDGTNVANRIALDKDRTVGFWVDIAVPPATRAGEYTGAITLKAAARQVAQVPVTLRVLDLEIPASSTLPSLCHTYITPHMLPNLDAYVAQILAHRLQPHTNHGNGMLTNPRYGPDVLAKLNPGNRGWQAVYIWVPQKKESWPGYIKEIKAYTDFFKQRQMMDRCYMTQTDIGNVKDPAGAQRLAEYYAALIQEVPEWKGKLLAFQPWRDDDLTKMLRCHVIFGRWYTSEPDARTKWDERRAAGHELWFLLGGEGREPSLDIDARQCPWQSRVYGWAYWRENVGGFIHWNLMHAESWKPTDGGSWQMYPGDFRLPDAPSWVLVDDLKGPVMSRRMKLIRQGLEDYELLKLAEKKASRQKVEAVVDAVYKRLNDWSREPAEWDHARQAVIQLISQ